jgi:hypothetical protein
VKLNAQKPDSRLEVQCEGRLGTTRTGTIEVKQETITGGHYFLAEDLRDVRSAAARFTMGTSQSPARMVQRLTFVSKATAANMANRWIFIIRSGSLELARTTRESKGLIYGF